MFTSRAEYRLLLRQDNADRRLTPIADDAGLVAAARVERLAAKESQIAQVKQLLETTRQGQITLTQVLKRTETTWQDLVQQLPALTAVSEEVADQVTYDIKYAGYVARQEIDVERQRRLSEKLIPGGFDFHSLVHLRNEAREKLARVQPRSLAQAGRISGITPADLALLMVYLTGRD
jgi:tRNA uridine 5-carboxymethylaminomethyl modification enzyme